MRLVVVHVDAPSTCPIHAWSHARNNCTFNSTNGRCNEKIIDLRVRCASWPNNSYEQQELGLGVEGQPPNENLYIRFVKCPSCQDNPEAQHTLARSVALTAPTNGAASPRQNFVRRPAGLEQPKQVCQLTYESCQKKHSSARDALWLTHQQQRCYAPRLDGFHYCFVFQLLRLVAVIEVL